jgi:hypothetical protein
MKAKVYPKQERDARVRGDGRFPPEMFHNVFFRSEFPDAPLEKRDSLQELY